MFNKNKFARILKNIGETFENQRDFSKKSEINRTYLSKYMNMKIDKPPKPDILKKIADNSKGITTYKELMEVCGYIEQAKNMNDFLNTKESLETEFKNVKLTFKEQKFVEDFLKKADDLSDYLKKNYQNTDDIPDHIIKDKYNKIMKDLNFNMFSFSALGFIRVSKAINLGLEIKDVDKSIKNMFDYTIEDNKKNNINSKSKGIQVPVLGYVRAGIPLEAIEDILDYEEIPTEWSQNGSEYFGLSVKGDSMFPYIIETDVVIFKKQNDCENGEIAVVLVNGDEATIKKIQKDETGIDLIPFNPMYPKIHYTNEDIQSKPVIIVGVFKELRRKNFNT